MTTSATLRTLWVSLRAIVLFTLVCGVIYPAVITVVGGTLMPDRAQGQMLSRSGHVVGSRLIGQAYTRADGTPDPAYLQGRPSAAGDHGYDALASGATNAGPENPDLIASIRERRQAEAASGRTGTAPAAALTASSSGLDPHVTPADAEGQVARIAKARGMDPARVRAIITRCTQARELGILGDPRVNVLEVNLALDAQRTAAR